MPHLIRLFVHKLTVWIYRQLLVPNNILGNWYNDIIIPSQQYVNCIYSMINQSFLCFPSISILSWSYKIWLCFCIFDTIASNNKVLMYKFPPILMWVTNNYFIMKCKQTLGYEQLHWYHYNCFRISLIISFHKNIYWHCILYANVCTMMVNEFYSKFNKKLVGLSKYILKFLLRIYAKKLCIQINKICQWPDNAKK